jgi:hypothetical protein
MICVVHEAYTAEFMAQTGAFHLGELCRLSAEQRKVEFL